MITIPELYALTDLDTVIHIPTGEEYAVELYPNLIRFYNSKRRSHVKIVLSNPTTYQSYNVPGSYAVGHTITMLMEFKKKEESKMKTEFKQAEPKKPNTYPSFMLNKTKGYVVLFFRDGCGVVVSGCNDYEVNHFSTSWLMEVFTPVEGCSVTFSDKD